MHILIYYYLYIKIFYFVIVAMRYVLRLKFSLTWFWGKFLFLFLFKAFNNLFRLQPISLHVLLNTVSRWSHIVEHADLSEYQQDLIDTGIFTSRTAKMLLWWWLLYSNLYAQDKHPVPVKAQSLQHSRARAQLLPASFCLQWWNWVTRCSECLTF